MAVNWSTAAKTSRLAASLDLIDVGGGPATLEIGTAGMASILAIITLAVPSFTISGDTMTLASTPRSDSSADNSGVATEARIKDRNGVIVLFGLTVGTSGSNITFVSVNFQAGQTITLNSGTITHG